MKRFRLYSLVLATVLLLLGSKPAKADTSVSNPNDGFGSSYTLTVTSCGGSGCTVTLTIDTTALTNPSQEAYIDAVAFKLGNGATFTGTLTAPAGATQAPPPNVSEPGSLAIMGFGMVGLAALLRRRNGAQA